MNIVVTGSNGFVGQNLIEYLQKKFPDANLNCLVRIPKDNSCGIIYHCVDYCCSESLVNCSDIFENVDYVFHIAGVTKGICENDFVNGNFIPTKNLLEIIKNHSKNLKRFVLISSLAACGPAESLDFPISEICESKPIEFYGKSKLLAEKITLEYSEFFPVTIIRPSAVYGPKDVDFLNLFRLINKNLKLYYGNKSKYISLIFVRDLVEGIVNAAFNENAVGQTYNLSHSEIITWQNLQDQICEIVGKNAFEINIPAICLNIFASCGEIYSKIFKKNVLLNRQKIKMNEPNFWVCSSEKAEKELGFIAKTDLKDGLIETFEYYKNQKFLD